MYLSIYIQEQVINLKLAISNQSSSSKQELVPYKYSARGGSSFSAPLFFSLLPPPSSLPGQRGVRVPRVNIQQATILFIIINSLFSCWEQGPPGPPCKYIQQAAIIFFISLFSCSLGTGASESPVQLQSSLLFKAQSETYVRLPNKIIPYLYHQTFQAFLSLSISMCFFSRAFLCNPLRV